MAASILLVTSVFLIKGGTGVLLHHIGYNESTPVYIDAPYLNKKQNRNRHMYTHVYVLVPKHRVANY